MPEITADGIALPGAAPPLHSTAPARNYCTACGVRLEVTYAFCGGCGQRLTVEADSRAQLEVDDATSVTWKQARALLMSGALREATPLLESLCREHPEWMPARAYLGVAYLRTGRVTEAQLTLEEALRLAPDDFSCRFAYAEYLARLGFYDRAVVELDRVLQLVAPTPEAYNGALELRRLCATRAKGLYYRQTVLPRLPRVLRHWRRGRRAEESSTPAMQPRSN